MSTPSCATGIWSCTTTNVSLFYTETDQNSVLSLDSSPSRRCIAHLISDSSNAKTRKLYSSHIMDMRRILQLTVCVCVCVCARVCVNHIGDIVQMGQDLIPNLNSVFAADVQQFLFLYHQTAFDTYLRKTSCLLDIWCCIHSCIFKQVLK